MDDSTYADLLPSLSPLEDPDAAMLDRKGTMDKLLGPVTPEPQSWLDRARAADSATPPPMAATATPPSTPAVPAGVTPSGKTSGLADSNASTIGLMQSDYAKSSQDVQREADQPDLATTTAPIQAQRTKDAAPIPAYDAQTGKVLDKYKPSFGQRLMRGVEGFARGGVLGVVDPAVGGSTPYGAPNQQYGRDVQQQQGRVASDDQQLSNAAANWKATSERIKQVASDRRALATTGKDVTGASIDQQKIPIEQQKADTDQQKVDEKPDRTPHTYEETVAAAALETDPVKKAALQDAAKAMESSEKRKFSFANRGSGSTANASVPTPSGPLSPAAKAVIDGRSKMPPANARNPDAQALRKEVFANAPNYDETAFPTYAKTRADFTSGAEGKGINFIKTARNHLTELEQHIPDNVDVPLVGSAINWAKNSATRSTSPQLKAFESARNAVTAEVAKAYAGKAITQGEHDDMLKLINENDSPKALRSGIEEFRKLLGGKEQSYREQWNSGMPTGAVLPLSTLEPDAAPAAAGGFDWNAHPEAK